MNDVAEKKQTEWKLIGNVAAIPKQGARTIRLGDVDIAIFRTVDDEIFAINDRCPHKGGPLSQGIVHGKRVTCPLHNWMIDLLDGRAIAPDVGCARTYPTNVVEGDIYIEIDH
ncbi:MAG: nitrite reductase small subunit NirD [Gammaproteobacteria bacterium]|nr:nitrite reductase small subunit NirD [Gammaproteobacteria bacterium]